MILYALIALTTIILAYMTIPIERHNEFHTFIYRGSRKQLKNQVLLIAIFLILFSFSAVRYGIGNDYLQYVKTFHEISVGGYVVTEIGFNFLVKCIYFLCGFEAYEIVFAIFAFFTLWIFLYAMWKYSEDFQYTFFLFMALGMYFQTYNTVRYYFALAVVMIAMQFVVQRKEISFLLLILATAFIHKSVLIVIPLFFLARITWKKWQMLLFVTASALCFLLQKPMLHLALYLYPSYRNTIYLEGGTSIISIIRCILVCLLTIKYFKTIVIQNKTMLFYSRLNIMAIIVYVFFSFLPVITRVGYYLTISHVMYIPMLLRAIQNEKERKLVKMGITILAIGYFLIFLYKANAPGVQLLPYQTWLFMEERIHIK